MTLAVKNFSNVVILIHTTYYTQFDIEYNYNLVSLTGLYSNLNNYFSSKEGSVLINQLEEFRNYRLSISQKTFLTVPSFTDQH